MCVGAPLASDLLNVRVIARELEDQAIGIGHVYRATVAMLQHVGVGRLDTCLGNARLDGGLSLGIDPQRDVMERSWRHLRTEFLLIRRIGELKERQRTPIADAIE